jgi:osmotically-inducible protein OsmY
MTKIRKMYIGALGLTVATAFSTVATAGGTCVTCGDDAQIEASVKTSFQELPYLGWVHVQTRNHVVYLSGEVSAGLMSLTAAQIANGTPSVQRVVNTISFTK